MNYFDRMVICTIIGVAKTPEEEIKDRKSRKFITCLTLTVDLILLLFTLSFIAKKYSLPDFLNIFRFAPPNLSKGEAKLYAAFTCAFFYPFTLIPYNKKRVSRLVAAAFEYSEEERKKYRFKFLYLFFACTLIALIAAFPA